ncbi:NAD(P)-binding protein [Agrocybe pediades]|nr:NAD(P)-binding protein [Agrocybe pediades]
MPPSTTPTGVSAILSASSSSTPPPTRSALSLFALPSRVAIITGAHRGIGLEIALAYAEAGAIVYCLDLPEKPDGDWVKVRDYVAALPPLSMASLTGRFEYAHCDVTNQQAMFDLAARIAEKEGRIDICFANAGILSGAEVLDYPGEDFKKIIDVNINGALFTAQAAGREMVKRNIAGSIIFTASMSGSITNYGMHWTAYNTSKAAVIQMARSLACELGPKRIRVNSISPGYIYTEMTKAFLQNKPDLEKSWCAQNPLGRLGNPDELRGIALFLASDASTFCTGSDLIVDGGHRAW